MKEIFGMSKGDFYKWMDNMLYPTLEYRSIEKDYDISKNVNSSICSECGGACCKSCGCHFSPDDFKDISFEGLKHEIEKGYISIDLVDREVIYQDSNVYILRVRNQGAPIIDIDLGRRTPCILLSEKGCKLDYEHRPTGGKLLIPSSISSFTHLVACKSNYTIRNCCYEWLPHKRILHRLLRYFENKDFPSSL